MHGLVTGIGIRQNAPGMVNATWEYAGHLQKLAEKLSFIQNKIFSSRLGRLAKPFVALKESIAASMANGVMAAIIAATGGSAAALAPLKFALQWAIKKSLDLAQNLFTGILKGDLSSAFRGMEKALMNIIKTLMLLTGLPILLTMLFIFLLFNVFYSVISPIDSTRAAHPSIIGGIYGRSGYTGFGDELRDANLRVMDSIGRCSNGDPFIQFSDGPLSWENPASDYAAFDTVARTLSSNEGFVDTVCDCRSRGYEIDMIRSAEAPGWCGQHLGNGRIIFYSTCSYEEEDYLTYLMAHEIGHALWWCLNPDGVSTAIAQARQAQENAGLYTSQGTYIGNGCSLYMGTTTPWEEFADMVGNYFVFNAWDCQGAVDRFCGGASGNGSCPGGYERFWEYYQIYRDFIEGWVFSGGWLNNPGDPPAIPE